MATVSTSAHGKVALAVARDRLLAELKARHGSSWVSLPENQKLSELAHFNATETEASTFVTALDAALP